MIETSIHPGKRVKYLAKPSDYKQAVRSSGDNATIIQSVSRLTVYERSREVQKRIENPEIFYLPPRRSRRVSDKVQRSNIERKMGKFGKGEVVYAQERRAEILVVLQRMTSISEYSQEHLEWIMRNLEDCYRKIYVAAVRISPDDYGVAYKDVLDSLDGFCQLFNHERLPLTYNVVVSLLFNATGLCDIDWTIPGGSENAP